MAGVYGGHPDEAAPADHVPSAVKDDVDAPEIAGLPPEKFGAVDLLKKHRDDHRVGNEPINLVLLDSVDVGQQSPRHHTEAAVSEYLDIEAKNTRVKLSSFVEVENGVAGGAGVRGRGEIDTLEVEHCAQTEGDETQISNDLKEMIVNDGKVEESAEVSSEEENIGDEVVLHAVGLVDGNMARWGDGTEELLAGEGHLQKGFDDSITADDFPSDHIIKSRVEFPNSCRDTLDTVRRKLVNQWSNSSVEVDVDMNQQDSRDGGHRQQHQANDGSDERVMGTRRLVLVDHSLFGFAGARSGAVPLCHLAARVEASSLVLAFMTARTGSSAGRTSARSRARGGLGAGAQSIAILSRCS